MDPQQQAKQSFKENSKLGIKIQTPMTLGLPENKHGIDNPVDDLNVTGSPGSIPLTSLEPIPDHTYLGNTSGVDASPSIQDLGINAHFYTTDGKGVTVVNGLVTLVTSTSTSSSTHSTSSSSSHSTSSSSSTVSTSSSSSSSSSLSTSSSSSS